MADAPTTPPEDDMHWGIAYLREDIQDLRLGLRALHDRVDRLAEAMATQEQIHATNARIEAVNESLIARMDAMNESLIARMDAMNESLTRRIDSRFGLLLTAMIGLTGMSIGANFAVLQFYLPAP